MERVYRAMVLQGGAAFGAFQAGAIQRAFEILPSDTTVNTVVAASVGSLNGAMLAAQPIADILPGANKAVDVWRNEIAGKEEAVYTPPLFNVDTSMFRKGMLLLKRAHPAIFKAALLKPGGLGELLKKYVDIEQLLDDSTERPGFFCNSLCLGDLTTVYFSKRSMRNLLNNAGMEAVMKVFLASTAVSCVFPPVGIELKHLGDSFLRENTQFRKRNIEGPVLFVDGAVRDNAPVSFACKMANTAMMNDEYSRAEIMVFLCSNNSQDNKWEQKSKHLPMGVHVALRTFQAMSDEIADQDIKDCRVRDWDHPIELKVWKPQVGEIKGELLTFQEDDVLENIELGRKAADIGPTTQITCSYCGTD
jgi:predicted acylesterase/phospholipase RssA